jgi:hypothetical protein
MGMSPLDLHPSHHQLKNPQKPPKPKLPPLPKAPIPPANIPLGRGDHALKLSPKLKYEIENGELVGAHRYRGPIKV